MKRLISCFCFVAVALGGLASARAQGEIVSVDPSSGTKGEILVLTITGERKEEELPEGARYLFNERTTGRFTRNIALPVEVDKDKIRAEFKNGLLRITLPKHEETKPKEIEIN